MDTMKDGDIFTLKIYRKGEHLMIDINDLNKSEMDINSEETCSSFWASEISGVYFLEESRDVTTHYRMVVGDIKIRDFVAGILIQA